MSEKRKELLNKRFELMQRRIAVAKKIDEITADDPEIPDTPGIVYHINRPLDITTKLYYLSCEHFLLTRDLDDNKMLLKAVK